MMAFEARQALLAQGVLASEEGVFVGACVLHPGEVFPNHCHELHEEVFIAVEGSAELLLDESDIVTLRAGSLAICKRGVRHQLSNKGTVPFRAYFVKSPNVPDDRVDAPCD